MADRRPRRDRGLFWGAILVALVALIGGGTFAYVTYAATAGPDGAVKGYFAALARADAPGALGFGKLPPGPHGLLTSTVLRAQRKIAPIRHVEIIATDQSGDSATVTVQYALDFAGGSQQIADDVQVVRHKGSWRLVRTAAATRLRLLQAGDRATIRGASIPDGAVLIFPGAVPISFDTPYLGLTAAARSVTLSAKAETDLSVVVTAAGRSAVDAAVTTAVEGCLGASAPADPRCPLPTSRAVPGSLRAAVSADRVHRAAVIGLEATTAGVLTVGGKLTLTGSYATLDFENQPVARHGTVSLPLTATAYATDPVTVDWAGGP